MNGLFGRIQTGPSQPVHPDVAAAMGEEMGTPKIQQQMAPQQQQMAPPPLQAEMSPQQAEIDAINASQQPIYKYSIGNNTVDRYLNMFLGD